MMLPVLTIILIRLGLHSMAYGEELSSEFDKRLYDFGIGKRAYSYVMSDHKRLPSYNFGLGKRGIPEKQMYAFGLGKRQSPYSNKDIEDFLNEQQQQNEELSSMIDKRGKQYSFGLGKRLKQYSFGLGKRYDQDNMLEDYDTYVNSKRGGDNHNRFAFGIGKRDVSDVLYDEQLAEKLSAQAAKYKSSHHGY